MKLQTTKILATLIALVALATTASAMDSNCTQVGSYSTNQIYREYLLAANFGYTPWQVNPTVAVFDRCDHGAIWLTINLYNAAVKTKPGGTVMVAAYYYVPGRGWVAAAPLVETTPAASGWITFNYNLGYGMGHVDLCRTCRITHFLFVTSVWTRNNEGSGWVGLSTKYLTLNLLNPAWSSN
jgi:hypothetical protein